MSSCTAPDEPTVVTYWMNRLQGLVSPQEYLVTLNARERIEPDHVLAAMDYEHPIYTPESVRAQSRLGGLATDQTVYAGAYHGWGFHEDGCRSGRRGCPALRGDLVSPAARPGRQPGTVPQLPALRHWWPDTSPTAAAARSATASATACTSGWSILTRARTALVPAGRSRASAALTISATPASRSRRTSSSYLA